MPSNPYPSGRTARNASPVVPVESYSQPAPAATEVQATNYPAASPTPAAPGFLGQIPGQVYCPVSRDPYQFAYETYPVVNSAGDSPIVRTEALRFTLQDPYSRPAEGSSASPKDPREDSPTGVSYAGSHG